MRLTPEILTRVEFRRGTPKNFFRDGEKCKKEREKFLPKWEKFVERERARTSLAP